MMRFRQVMVQVTQNVFIADRNGAGTNRKSIRRPILGAEGGRRTPVIWFKSQRSVDSLHCWDARRSRPAAVMLYVTAFGDHA